MIPWWGGLALFVVGVMVGFFLIALLSTERGD